MSTIQKLDPNVRLDRYLRKEKRRQMQEDLKTIDTLIARGQQRLKYEASVKLSTEYIAAPDYLHLNIAANETKALLGEMHLRRAVTAVVLERITEICKNPRMTGVRKDELLAKLERES